MYNPKIVSQVQKSLTKGKGLLSDSADLSPLFASSVINAFSMEWLTFSSALELLSATL